jgi:hypothetical protein
MLPEIAPRLIPTKRRAASIALRAGTIAGADVGGALYDGSYTENQATGEISVNVTMNAPAGVAPVQTGIPLAAPAAIPIIATVKVTDFLTEKPILIKTPIGPVNVIFSKIRD